MNIFEAGEMVVCRDQFFEHREWSGMVEATQIIEGVLWYTVICEFGKSFTRTMMFPAKDVRLA